MNALIDAFRGRDLWVPAFEVRLRGRPLDEAVVKDIISVEYQDDVDAIDSFTIQLNNWDSQRRDYRHTEQDLLLPGKELELWLGYRGSRPLTKVVTGQIHEISPAFPAAGQPTVTVSGLNVLHQFRQKQVSAAYENKSDADIAREIAARLRVPIRIPPEAEGGVIEPHVLQANQYDIVFLLRRARRRGFDVLVEESDRGPGLYFGPSETIAARPVYPLHYGRTLVDFSPKLTTANQVGQVVVRAWDPVRKKLIEGKASRSQLNVGGVGGEGVQEQVEGAFGQREEVVADQPVRSQAEADRLARSVLERIAKNLVKASGSVFGLPDLRAGSIVEIDGVGRLFRGQYFVTRTTHSNGDGGYTTKFDCRLEQAPR